MISRGNIYFVNLGPTKGREQEGYRPVLVVSVDAINRQPFVVTVVVGTDAKKVLSDWIQSICCKKRGINENTVADVVIAALRGRPRCCS